MSAADMIIARIGETVRRVWERAPYPDHGIAAKIGRGEVLSREEQQYFIQSEGWKMHSLRGVLPYVLKELTDRHSDIAEILMGTHTAREAVRGGYYVKKLLLVDSQERFYVDLFFFPPGVETPEHNHNSYCVSF